MKINYYWVRIFTLGENEPEYEEEGFGRNKGTLLDEYYLCGDTLDRESVKAEVKMRSNVDKFQIPKRGRCGTYAIIMDSDKFYYDRFCVEVDDICFNCHAPIKGKMKDFPSIRPIEFDPRYCTIEESSITEYDEATRFHFCSYECRRQTALKLKGNEGEWQEREGYDRNGGIFGYIYHIYNRKTNMHYIGQTKYMPFFRWQEHAKSKVKGEITDLVFDVICEVRVKDNQYLNNIEAWWIQSFIDEYGKDRVMNISNPQLTMQKLIQEYQNIKCKI